MARALLNAVSRPPLLIVLGPTGSGKSAIAHEIARRRAGEIISADAFAVYRGLDIGTAKPTREEREEVPYHLIDAAEPWETFSAGRWSRDARTAVDDIARRGRVPIVCGGSGFYIAALLEGLPPGEAVEPRLRRQLNDWAADHREIAWRMLAVNDPVSAGRIERGNLRYTLRALEILLATGAPASARSRAPDAWADDFRVVKLGLALPARDLYVRIAARVRRMLEEGWDAEIRELLARDVSIESNAFRAIGYREVADWIEGRAGRSETEEKIVTATRQLARRQMTWFKRERGIEWVRPEEALEAASGLLDRVETGRSG